MDAVSNVPLLTNEPVRMYAPGSAERAGVEALRQRGEIDRRNGRWLRLGPRLAQAFKDDDFAIHRRCIKQRFGKDFGQTDATM